MTSMTHDDPQITGGVDTHGLTHHAAVVDQVGRHLADQEFPATIRGYRDLLDWIRSHGALVAVGVLIAAVRSGRAASVGSWLRQGRRRPLALSSARAGPPYLIAYSVIRC